MLQMRVSQIQLMNLDKIPHGKVGFGSTVTLHDQTGQTIVYQLVMPEDANVDEGMISTASPSRLCRFTMRPSSMVGESASM